VTTAYLLERAWVDGAVHDDVLVEIEDGRFTKVQTGSGHLDQLDTTLDKLDHRGADRLAGLTIPGLANCHSHAFHRALRGRTQRERGTFWTWREQMYAVAGRLDPDGYFLLARAVYREMAAAGITAVGEFHYLHHQPDGTPYDDPNAMGHALLAAAREAGIRIALLDTCYLAAGFDKEPEGVQRRFSDGTATAWAERVSLLRDVVSTGSTTGWTGSTTGWTGSTGVGGAAVHSVRAVPAHQLDPVVAWAGDQHAPLHVHLSEQVAENEACLAAHGLTPTQLLHEHGALGPRTSVVHATHLTTGDVALLGGESAYACITPTTERDLGDGIGPSTRLHEAGARLTLGSDSHAVVDLFEEMRAVELDERLATQQRGHWSAGELLTAATGNGHASLGFDDAGRIAVGQRADLVTLRTDSPRTAGTGRDEHTAVFAATAADVVQVVADGRVVHRAGDEDEIGRELDRVIGRLWA
jgi:formiminoglutamate deiminase